jgi:O-antigen ligase
MFLKRLAFFLAIVAVNNGIALTPKTPTVVYASFFLFAFTIILLGSKPKLFMLAALVLIACIVSVFINDIPEYFHSGERLLSFLFIFSCISPFVYTQKLSKFRIYLFRYSTFFIAGIIVLSILAKFTGIYSGTNAMGLFQGLTVHSMLLGPLSAITLIFSLWKVNSMAKNNKIRNRYIVIICFSFLCLLLAASRGAIIGAVIGLLIMFVSIYKNKIQGFVKVLFILLFVLVSTSSLWSGYLDGIIKKNEATSSEHGLASARSELWTYRIQEFNENPLFGIGFSTSKFGLIDTEVGQIEPGTSWGAIFAQIGLLGGLPFLFMIVYYFNFLIRSQDKFNNGAVLLGMLSFFVIHWFAEGYMLASGGFLFFYAWLLLGVIDAYKRNKDHFISTAILN